MAVHKKYRIDYKSIKQFLDSGGSIKDAKSKFNVTGRTCVRISSGEKVEFQSRYIEPEEAQEGHCTNCKGKKIAKDRGLRFLCWDCYTNSTQAEDPNKIETPNSKPPAP